MIKVIVGPEILSGSTRLKSGTATKMVLNMISTATMIKLNRTFGNVMIDLLPKNKKLINRSIDIIVDQLSIDRQKAKSIYDMSGGLVKKVRLTKDYNIIDCSDLSKGAYIYSILSPETILSTEKLFIY